MEKAMSNQASKLSLSLLLMAFLAFLTSFCCATDHHRLTASSSRSSTSSSVTDHFNRHDDDHGNNDDAQRQQSKRRRRTTSSSAAASSPLVSQFVVIPSSSPSSMPSTASTTLVPSQQPSSSSLLSINFACFYVNENHTRYSCESIEFSELQFDQCEIDLNYTFSIRNRSDRNAKLDSLLNEDLVEFFDDGQSRILGKKAVTDIETTGSIDICQGNSEVTKKVLAIASPLSGGADVFPFAQDSIVIPIP